MQILKIKVARRIHKQTTKMSTMYTDIRRHVHDEGTTGKRQ